MNIFFVNPHNRICGGNKVVFEYCNHLAKRFQKCFVACDDLVPDWISVDAFFLDRATALELIKPEDYVIFHWDYDAAYVLKSPAENKVYLIQHFIHLDENIFRLPLRFIAVSSYIKKHTKERYGIKSELVLNAIDHTVFHPMPINRIGKRIFVIDIGGWKGVDDVRAAQKLIEKRRKDATFIYKNGLRPAGIAKEYAKADIFISSSWYEGFGLPPLEAMACGAAVICTDSKGVDDFAVNDETCLKIPPRDPLAMAAAIERLLDDQDLREHLRRNGLSIARHFTWEASITRLAELLHLKEYLEPAMILKSLRGSFNRTTCTPFSRPYGDQKIHYRNAFALLLSIKGGRRLLTWLKKFHITENSEKGAFDYNKIQLVKDAVGHDALYVPPSVPGEGHRDIILAGIEESMEISDFGYRSRIIARELAAMPWVRHVVMVCPPESILRRWAQGCFKAKCELEHKHLLIYRHKGINVFKVSENLLLVSLVSFFPETLPVLPKLERHRIFHRLFGTLQQLGIKQDIFWFDTPRLAGMAACSSAPIRIFDCIDNMLKLTEKKSFYPIIKQGYKWADMHASIIYVASLSQNEMFTNQSKVRHLPNAVDERFFNKAYVVPDDLKMIPSPRIGYIGFLQDRFDIDLACSVIEGLPKFSFVFIGPISVPVYEQRLKALPNVYLLGTKPYQEIPAYIKSMDAVMIPHRINELTSSMDPMKLYEAIACGLSVVATPVAMPEDLKASVRMASTTNDFINHLRAAVTTNQEARALLQHAAKRHSWSIRLSRVRHDIAEIESQ